MVHIKLEIKTDRRKREKKELLDNLETFSGVLNFSVLNELGESFIYIYIYICIHLCSHRSQELVPQGHTRGGPSSM